MAKEAKTTQEISKEDIKQMKEILAEEVIAEAVKTGDNSNIREIVTCKNIEMGEKKLREFTGVVRLTRYIPKQGRGLSYNELEKEMPVMFEAIENIEGNPVDVIVTQKAFTSDLMLDSNEQIALRRLNATIEKIKQEQGEEVAKMIKEAELEQRKSLQKEIKKVQEQGVDWDENIVFDIWMIQRGKRQRAYMEGEKLPVDMLIELYSYIPNTEYKKIKEYYQSTFNN